MATFAEVLPKMLHDGAEIYRVSEPRYEYSFDAAEGATIWRYDIDEDEFIPYYKFYVQQIVAKDWEYKLPPISERV